MHRGRGAAGDRGGRGRGEVAGCKSLLTAQSCTASVWLTAAPDRPSRPALSTAGATAVTIECPYCQHTTALKAARPGRFTSACPKCARKFLIAIPDDPAGTPSITKLRAEPGGGATEQSARASAPP